MQHDTIADLLLDRLGDNRPGLRTRERTWTWDDVVKESAARAALATELRTEGPFHIGILLANVPEFLFWLGGAALSGATVVGINSTRRGPDLEQEVRHTDCQAADHRPGRPGTPRRAGHRGSARPLPAGR